MFPFRPGLLTAVTCVLLLLVGEPSQAQASPERTVIIAVMEDLPAFRPKAELSHPEAAELRGIVFLRDPGGADNSLVLISPAHLTVETLHEALRVLQRLRTRPNGAALGVLKVTSRPPSVHARDTITLRTRLSELESQQLGPVSKMMGAGRHIVVEDLSRLFIHAP